MSGIYTMTVSSEEFSQIGDLILTVKEKGIMSFRLSH